MRDIPETFTPYAVVTPDGEWHDWDGTFDWSDGYTEEANEKYRASKAKREKVRQSELGRLVAPFGGKNSHVAVLVDCHD